MGPMTINGLLLALAVASVTAQQQPSNKGPNYFNPKSFNPSMAIVMVVLVTAFFLVGFFSIYLRRCAGPPLGGPYDDEYPYHLRLRRPGAGISYAPSSRRMRGLDRAVLDSFPTMGYDDVRAHSKDNGALECAVCLCEFDDDDTLRLLLPRCAHAFHADCIDAWLASHVTCPVCRAVLAVHDDAPVVPVAMEQHNQVVVVPAPAAPVDDDDAAAGDTETEEQRIRREEAAELTRIGSALRSKSGRSFPRSHTTGHSDPSRYTLRLPDHVLREVVAAGNLGRSASVQTTTGTSSDGTVATRHSLGAARSIRLGNSSGRWPNMTLLARTFSAWGSLRRGEAKGAKFAGDDGRAAVEQCDAGACPLGAYV